MIAQMHPFFIRTLFIGTSRLSLDKIQEHFKNVAQPQFEEKLKTFQPHGHRLRMYKRN